MNKPNLFMIGGPKCGTTSFQEYLATHPQILMSDPKEPCYFDKDIPFPNSPRTEAEYMRCFKGAGKQHTIVGEASTNYLYSKVAVSNVLRFNPDARFIVMLRNPIDMASSLHAEAVKTLTEDVVDFRAAWKLQDERRQGRALPRVCYQKDFVLYGDFCKLGEQLQRLYFQVARHRINVIFMDDLARDPRGSYLRTLQFLGLPDDGRTEFPVRNANAEARSRLAREMTTRLFALRQKISLPFRMGLISKAIHLNSRDTKRQALAPDFRQELADYFRADVELLSQLTDRDLTGWLRPPSDLAIAS